MSPHTSLASPAYMAHMRDGPMMGIYCSSDREVLV